MYCIGILDGEPGAFGVRIPDYPGVHGGGETAEEAIADATSALREVGAIWAAEGTPMAKPRTLGEIMLDQDARPCGNEMAVMIPVLVDRGRSVRANVSVDAGVLETIDQEATRRGLTRSSFMVSATLDKIQRSA